MGFVLLVGGGELYQYRPETERRSFLLHGNDPSGQTF